jgi:hypothetical protein
MITTIAIITPKTWPDFSELMNASRCFLSNSCRWFACFQLLLVFYLLLWAKFHHIL